MKRSFLFVALGFLGLAFSSETQAQRVSVSINTGGRCGTVYAKGGGFCAPKTGFCVSNFQPGAIYRPAPVVFFSAPACYSGYYYGAGPYYSGYYSGYPYYSGYTTGTVYTSGYGVNDDQVVRVENVGAPVRFSSLINQDQEPRKLKLRTSR